MSNWSATQLTDAGRALDAKVTGGLTTLSFTKMKLGSGATTAADIPSMTDLTTPELVLGISSCAVAAADPTVCEVISIASSDDVSTSFVVRELGIFATDPDDGEILYAVMLDSTPDTMPNSSVASPVTVTYQVNIVSANASSITAVIDPAGLVNVAALNAAINAHDSSAASHAAVFAEYTKTINAPMFNKRDTITTSRTYTAPVTGWYKITVKGGGSGGQGGLSSNNVWRQGGYGGSEGGTSVVYLRMTTGNTVSVVIGAGGTGGAADGGQGGNGGDSSITINGATYTAYGGTRLGGSGNTRKGNHGTFGQLVPWSVFNAYGGNGGNGGRGGAGAAGMAGVDGGGGGGGAHSNGTNFAGGAGGNGFVWFEYFDSSLNP